MRHIRQLIFLVLALPLTVNVYAEAAPLAESDIYKELIEDGNPAEFREMRGEEVWQQKAGPNNVSLQQCDLGKGPGVIEGAYVELPKYFSDAKKVMDLEQRLIYCKTTIQGITYEQAISSPFSIAGQTSDVEALVAYITAASKGMKMAVKLNHPMEKEAYEVGKKLFFYRAGSHDFGCVTCHSSENKRIRLQNLPNLLNANDAQATYTTWPAYRLSQGEVRTMQHRVIDCLRQQRFPEAKYASDAITALTMFMAKNAEDGIYNAPAIKR
jgi:L-cysteine S-thiosulfotransferase